MLLAALLAAAVVEAPPRSPDQRQALVDLAYALGEAHGLRTACRGAEDQTWRARMARVLEVERPADDFRRRLVDGFNAGYATRRAEYPSCRDGAEAQERAAAARGRDLARRLTGGGG